MALPEVDEILKKVEALPPLSEGRRHSDPKTVWAGRIRRGFLGRHSASFSLARTSWVTASHGVGDNYRVEGLALNLSGYEHTQRDLLDRFREALGEPVSASSHEHVGSIRFSFMTPESTRPQPPQT